MNQKVPVVRIQTVEVLPSGSRLLTFGLPEVVIVDDNEYKPGDVAVFVPADFEVPGDLVGGSPGERVRVRPRQVDGRWSDGILIHERHLREDPDWEAVEVGDDVHGFAGIRRYDPEANHPRVGGETVNPEGIALYAPRYYVSPVVPHAFEDGEPVVITEKIHGCNSRYAWIDDRLWVGSKRQWKVPLTVNANDTVNQPSSGTLFHDAVTPALVQLCRTYPHLVFYGEVYGKGVQDLDYGCSKPTLRLFDAFNASTRRYLDAVDFRRVVPRVMRVPEVGSFWPGYGSLRSMVDGMYSVLRSTQMAEGVVVKPPRERYISGARCVYKMVSRRYLERSK